MTKINYASIQEEIEEIEDEIDSLIAEKAEIDAAIEHLKDKLHDLDRLLNPDPIE